MNGANGVYPTQLDGVQHLRERLNEPQTTEALDQILNNLELVAFSITALDGFVRRSDTIADSVAESLADVKASVPANVGDYGQQLAALLQALPQLAALSARLATLAASPEFNRLLDLLSSPQTLNNLANLLGQLELISFMVTALNGFLARGDTVADNIASSVAELRKLTLPAELNLPRLMQALPQLAQTLPQLIDTLPKLVTVMPQLIDVSERLQPVLQSPEFDALMQSGVLDPKTVNFIGKTGTTFVESLDANQRQPRQIGIWGLFQALNDPDVQRAVGFFIDFSKRFGQTVKQR